MKKTSYFIFINSYEYENSIPCWKELHLAIELLKKQSLKKTIEIKLGNHKTPSCIDKDQIYISFHGKMKDNELFQNLESSFQFNNQFIGITINQNFSSTELKCLYDILIEIQNNEIEQDFLNSNQTIATFLLEEIQLIVKKPILKEDVFNFGKIPKNTFILKKDVDKLIIKEYIEWLGVRKNEDN